MKIQKEEKVYAVKHLMPIFKFIKIILLSRKTYPFIYKIIFIN
jgi:hypothetical protein